MDVEEVLRRLGGVADRGVLIQATSRRDFDEAVRQRRILRVAQRRYASPHADHARREAHALSGVVGLRSAALHHGWAVKVEPERPDVVVPRTRKVPPGRRRTVTVHWWNLAADEVTGGVTRRRRTLRDCLRVLPYDEALAVADSALRSGLAHQALADVAREVTGPGAVRARAVAAAASPLAANPFESALRGICHQVPGLRVEPQLVAVSTPREIRPDLRRRGSAPGHRGRVLLVARRTVAAGGGLPPDQPARPRGLAGGPVQLARSYVDPHVELRSARRR